MYRGLLLLCLLGLVAGQCDRRRNIRSSRWLFQSGSASSASTSNNRWLFGQRGSSESSVETASAEIARKLIDAGRKMHDFCVAHSDRPLREVYGVEHYQLRVNLKEFSEMDIQVLVRNRLVVVHAQNCHDVYGSVRLLPDIVNPQGAVWKLKRDVLTVLFPYYMAQNSEVQSYCGREFSEEVFTVPKNAADVHCEADYDLNFGDAEFRRAILRFMAELAKNKGNEGSRDDGTVDYIDPHGNKKHEGTVNGNLDYIDDSERVVQRTSK